LTQTSWLGAECEAWPDAVGAGLGVDVALGLGVGLGLGLDGLAAANAFPPNRTATASTATAADVRAMRWELAAVMASSGRAASVMK
jgi:hypothetical protein